MKLIIAVLILIGARADASPELEYFLWPATEFKAQLEHSACDFFDERDLAPTAADKARLRRLKMCAHEAIKRAVEHGLRRESLPEKSSAQMKRLANRIIVAQEKFGFERLLERGLIEAKENLGTLIAFDAYVPDRAELEALADSLQTRLAQDPIDAEAVKWDLSILQQLTSVHNLAHAGWPIPAETCNRLLEEYFILVP